MDALQLLEDERVVLDVLEQERDSTWVALHGQQQVISRANIRRRFEYDYGQRIIEDRAINPHGEEAEEFFTLLETVPECVQREG